MSAYLLMLTKVTQTDGWKPYQSRVGDCFSRHRGRYVVKRSVSEMLERELAMERLTIFECPSMNAIPSMWASPEYAKIRKLRAGPGQLDLLAVAGM